MQYKILFVDDETANLRLLERMFRGTYEVLSASSAAEALELIAVHDVALIISDQRMPSMTGIEFLKRAAKMRPQTVRIMLTGYTDAGALVDAINSGVVYKYVTKPWQNDELHQTVKRALQHYETTRAQRQLQLQNERLQSRLRATRDSFVDVVARMMELKEPNSRAHAERTAEYAVATGKQLDMDPPEIELLSLAAFLHEAVLFRIPNHIMLKETPWSAEEHQIVQTNLEPGLQVLNGVPDLSEVVSILRFQYEHFDGSGRPSGFSRDQIPLMTRIVSVAAFYDSLVAPRTGRTALSPDSASVVLRSHAGGRFDPNIVEVFCSANAEHAIKDESRELVMS